MTHDPYMIKAAHVIPVEGPPLSHAGVVVQGAKIARIGPLSDLRREFPGIPELGDESHWTLTPGLVNAHCHLELGYLRSLLPPGHFVDWVTKLFSLIREQGDNLDLVVQQSVQAGLRELLSAGVTTVGDISKQTVPAREALQCSPLRVVSFAEMQGIGRLRAGLDQRLHLADSGKTDHLTPGWSPHAPYTVEGPALRQIVAHAVARHEPLCMHLAELCEEHEFLQHLSGRLSKIWAYIEQARSIPRVLDSAVPLCDHGPIPWASRWGLLPPGGLPVPVLLAHVNYVNSSDLEILASARASVAYCPRTRRFFGHQPPHRFMDMIHAGINVCLGTDSLASNPDLHLLREARELQRQHRNIPARLLLEMLSLAGAKALGLDNQLGSLVQGKQADIVAFATQGETSQEVTNEIIHQAPAPIAVWINGKKLI